MKHLSLSAAVLPVLAGLAASLTPALAQTANLIAATQAANPPASAVTVPVAATEPIHIGILAPHTSLTDPSVQAIGEQVRILLARSLSNPEMDAVLLFSATPEQVAVEAKQHHCAFIVDSTITQKKGSGLNRMMLLQGASMVMPMAGLAGSMAGMIAGTAAGAAANTASSMGVFVHPNTTWTFDYKLLPAGEDRPVLTQSESVRAKKEGEDVLTPMVQHAALAILTQAKKK